MKVVIWGTGYKERVLEDYFKENIEIAAFVDNNKRNWGKTLRIGEKEVLIVSPDHLKDMSFDYCLIAAGAYHIIMKQCIEELSLPEEKLIQAVDISAWDTDWARSIFSENVFEDPRHYRIDGNSIDLGEGHALPTYQKQFKMYDRFVPYLGQMVQKKEGKYVIDIGANVGDTLAAMINHTSDMFLCIEPVSDFYNLLLQNIQRMGVANRVYAAQAFITDRIEESYSAKVSMHGTAHKELLDDGDSCTVPSKTVDYIISEKGLDYAKIDLLKIDTDGFDADCIISAGELLKRGSPLIYWENYIETFEQYVKYLEAYSFLNGNGYTSFHIFDNYGNYLCKGNIDTVRSITDYMQRVSTGCIGNTFSYFDVLACKIGDSDLCEETIVKYLGKYSLNRIY